MTVVTFCDIDKNLIDSKKTFEVFGLNHSGEADIVILDIGSIFDYEESKADACKKEFMSIAIIDDESDYDAFKNFGINAWIKREEISRLDEIINLASQRL